MSADLSVRLAWPDDAPALAAIQRDLWDAGGLDLPPVPDHVAAWSRTISRPAEGRYRILVALEGPTPRGFAVVHPNVDPDADQVADGEIGEFSIHPDHRGRGHGSRLLAAAVDTLRADRFTRARWWISSTDDALRSFATEAGWAPDTAHRTLAAEDGTALRQVRLHTALV